MLVNHTTNSMTQGYTLYYVKTPFTWLWVLAGLASPLFLIFILLVLLLGIWKSSKPVLHILILCWIVPFSFYILYVVSAQLPHYFLPILIPLFSCIATTFEFKPVSWLSPKYSSSFLKTWGNKLWLAIAVLIIGYQAVSYLSADISLYRNNLTREQTSSAIQFYSALDEKYVHSLPSDRTYVIFRDVRMYFPDSASDRVLSFYVTTNYATVQKYKPDIILLWQQRISDYTSRAPAPTRSTRTHSKLYINFFQMLLKTG